MIFDFLQKVLMKYGEDLVEISVEDTLEDLGINSLAFIRIIIEIEEKYGFEFDDEDLNYQKFKYVKDVIEYIEKNKTRD